MLKLLKNFFGENDFDEIVKEINVLESEIEKLSDQELREESLKLKKSASQLLSQGENSDELLPRAFALVREAARRTLKQRHFDVQLIGGFILASGKIAQMSTGEGKTLAATLAAYFHGLSGKGVHVITVNDYLAQRDAVWMGQIYYALGLSVGCLTHEGSYWYDPSHTQESQSASWRTNLKPQNEIKSKTDGIDENEKDKERDTLGGFKVVHEFLRPVQRKEVYSADIVYGTNHEFGFDYLRDNLAYRFEDRVQRGHYYALIDEADSILIDEARTPLIIAAPDEESSEYYHLLSRITDHLQKGEDYEVDEKSRFVSITEKGIVRVEDLLKIKNLYAPENFRLVHYLDESLKAKALFHRDKQYVVKNGEVIIVDEFTGRLMPGRRYSGGLHQAIEAKEGMKIQQESKIFAQITIQNYFRLYEKIAGMTGTAQTSAEEFHKVYNLEVVSIPTNKPVIRRDQQDLIYKNTEAKYRAIVEKIRNLYQNGQPVLVGTVSIEKNEQISSLLKQAGVPHETLNAKNHEREGEIIAQAGKGRAVTVATNMAGRGVDIILGGNPYNPIEAQKVKDAGGLFVLGTERHEARRIDNQLRGRAGRQGDSGESQFFLSLEDDLLRIFGGERVKNLMETFNLPEDQPIESTLVSKVVNEAQKKVEGFNFDLRKHLLEYDDVLNKQRTAVYRRREEILTGDVASQIKSIIENVWKRIEAQTSARDEQEKIISEIGWDKKEIEGKEDLGEFLRETAASLINPENKEFLRAHLLARLDKLWMAHLENLEDLRNSVGIRAYGQRDPLVEYRHDSHKMFQDLFVNFETWFFNDFKKIIGETLNTAYSASAAPVSQRKENVYKQVGRNDPCPCGSGKKFKKCHGK